MGFGDGIAQDGQSRLVMTEEENNKTAESSDATTVGRLGWLAKLYRRFTGAEESTMKSYDDLVSMQKEALENLKLRNEVQRLQLENADHAREMRLRRHSSRGPQVALVAAIIALYGYWQQGRQFERNLSEQARQFAKNIGEQDIRFQADIKGQEGRLTKTIEAENARTRDQFDKANESRYLEKNWGLCEAIVDNAGQMRLRADPKAKSRFDQLLYGRSAMIQEFHASRLRDTMYQYRNFFSKCRTEVCLAKLQSCVEAMGCECLELLCRSAPSLPGCSKQGTVLDCRASEAACEKSREDGS
jgi:hypothetical protein